MTPELRKTASAFILCLLLSSFLNTILTLTLYPSVHDTATRFGVALVSRAAVGAMWIWVYRLITGEHGINPFINIVVTLLPLFIIHMVIGEGG